MFKDDHVATIEHSRSQINVDLGPLLMAMKEKHFRLYQKIISGR